MAIALGVALGTNQQKASGSTLALTTTNTVTAGETIILAFGWWNPGGPTIASASGGGLTWRVDLTGTAGSANLHAGWVSAYAPSGLASSTAITVTLTGSVAGDLSVIGYSLTGVASTSHLGLSGVTSSAAGTTWSSGSRAVGAGSILVAAAYEEGAGGNSSSTPPSTHLGAVNISGSSTLLVAAARIEAGDTPIATTGTWDASASASGVGYAEYLPAGAAAASLPPSPARPSLYLR
jgi:hypothetical protein